MKALANLQQLGLLRTLPGCKVWIGNLVGYSPVRHNEVGRISEQAQVRVRLSGFRHDHPLRIESQTNRTELGVSVSAISPSTAPRHASASFSHC
jgi:hypothetical protein